MRICVTKTFLYDAIRQARPADETVLGRQDCDVLVADPDVMTAGVLAAMPHVRTLISLSTGVDAVDHGYIQAHGLRLINAAGVFAAPIAEYIVGAILMDAVGFPRLMAQQRRREYARYRQRHMVRDCTVGFLGTGSIATAAARRLAALGCRIIGFKRHHVDALAPYQQLLYPGQEPDFYGSCDYLVVATDLNDGSRGLVDKDKMHMMKPSACLINIARGAVVVQDDLITALQDGALRAAVLDVFSTEPLPADSPLWSMDNVIVTPHTSGTYEYNHRDTIAYVLSALDRAG